MGHFKSAIEKKLFPNKQLKLKTQPLTFEETANILKKYGITEVKKHCSDSFGYALSFSLRRVNVIFFIDMVSYHYSYADISQKAESRRTYGVDKTFRFNTKQEFKDWVILVTKQASDLNMKICLGEYIENE